MGDEEEDVWPLVGHPLPQVPGRLLQLLHTSGGLTRLLAYSIVSHNRITSMKLLELVTSGFALILLLT